MFSVNQQRSSSNADVIRGVSYAASIGHQT